MQTVRTLCAEGQLRLTNARVDAPRLCAELLLARALGCDKVALIMRADDCPTAEQAATFESQLARREQGEPLAYILGVREFFGREFMVTPDTLIPRPETECLVEAVLAVCPETPLRFADIGTGSGCIGVTLAAERPHWRGCLLDISPQALDVARANARTHNVAGRAHAVQGNLLRLGMAGEALDLVVSNPPYVGATEYIQLERGVRDYEPRGALVPGPDGDAHGWNHLKALAAHAGRLLKPGGVCCVEHGAGQGAATRHFFAEARAWTDIQTGRDLAGRDRYCLCRKK